VIHFGGYVESWKFGLESFCFDYFDVVKPDLLALITVTRDYVDFV